MSFGPLNLALKASIIVNLLSPLTAIDQDGDKVIFPLAFSLVKKECIGAWSWFMACIRKHVTQRMGLCVISDRHAGILATMEEPEWRPSNAYHRFCLRHLLSNFNRAMGNVQLKKLFGRIVEQRQQVKVLNGLKAIGTAKREAIFWIDDVGEMLHMVHGGILHAERASTPGQV